MTLRHLKQVLETKEAHETLTVTEIRELLAKPSKEWNVGAGAPKGERVGSAKLTADDIRAIRAEAAADMSIGWSKRLAAKYGVWDSAIKKIVSKERWKHIN